MKPEIGGADAARDHLVALPGGDWALWRCICLRGAGFPSSLALQLAAPEAARAVDALLVAEEQRDEARIRAIEVLRPVAQDARGDRGVRLQRALKSITKGLVPDPAETEGVAGPELARLAEVVRQVDASQAVIPLAFEAGLRVASHALRELAADGRFREAVTWQNRKAIETGLDPLLRGSPDVRNRGMRRKEELVAMYLHRYSSKNESIGFFGPLGWGRFEDHEERMAVRPGARLLAHRRTYFEQWGIDAVASMLSRNEACLPWTMPARFGFARLDGSMVHSPLTGSSKVSRHEELAFLAADGRTSARQIAADLMRLHPAEFGSETAVYDVLKELGAKQFVVLGFHLPLTWEPDVALRALLQRIDDDVLREECLRPLRELESARASVADAAGDADKLGSALTGLEDTFRRLTDVEATRHAGATYGIRTLVTEDCRRDIDLTIGSKVLAEIGPALSLVLDTARWITHELAVVAGAKFRSIYETMTAKAGSRRVPFVDFWSRAQKVILGKKESAAAEVMRSMRARWDPILSLSEGQRRASFRSEELRPAISAAFAAPRPGWLSARNHAPDILLGTASLEALLRGEYYAVLGELHVGLTTVLNAGIAATHPDPEALARDVARDFPETLVTMTTSKTATRAGSRLVAGIRSPTAVEIELGLDSSSLPRDRVVRIAELFLEEDGDQLVVTTRDGSFRHDLMAVAGQALGVSVVNALEFAPEMAHTPRITFDNLVVRREEWQFTTATDLAFAQEAAEVDRFVAARRWAKAHGMPRFVFLRSSIEVKPLFVDLENPIAVNALARFVRLAQEHVSGSAVLRVSEMLPTLEECWLPDAEGNRYTSELRLIAVDQRR